MKEDHNIGIDCGRFDLQTCRQFYIKVMTSVLPYHLEAPRESNCNGFSLFAVYFRFIRIWWKKDHCEEWSRQLKTKTEKTEKIPKYQHFSRFTKAELQILSTVHAHSWMK